MSEESTFTFPGKLVEVVKQPGKNGGHYYMIDVQGRDARLRFFVPKDLTDKVLALRPSSLIMIKGMLGSRASTSAAGKEFYNADPKAREIYEMSPVEYSLASAPVDAVEKPSDDPLDNIPF